MPETITIKLSRLIKSVALLDGFAKESDGIGHKNGKAVLHESDKKELADILSSLKSAIEELNKFQEELFSGHKEQIAKLSVGIAKKILAQKIGKGDYEIEAIVQEALENVPTRKEMVIHLNPQDMIQFQNATKDAPNKDLDGVRFIADANIGRAECMVETSSGIVESTIEKHLERIGEAIKKVE